MGRLKSRMLNRLNVIWVVVVRAEVELKPSVSLDIMGSGDQIQTSTYKSMCTCHSLVCLWVSNFSEAVLLTVKWNSHYIFNFCDDQINTSLSLKLCWMLELPRMLRLLAQLLSPSLEHNGYCCCYWSFQPGYLYFEISIAPEVLII